MCWNVFSYFASVQSLSAGKMFLVLCGQYFFFHFSWFGKRCIASLSCSTVALYLIWQPNCIHSLSRSRACKYNRQYRQTGSSRGWQVSPSVMPKHSSHLMSRWYEIDSSFSAWEELLLHSGRQKWNKRRKRKSFVTLWIPLVLIKQFTNWIIGLSIQPADCSAQRVGYFIKHWYVEGVRNYVIWTVKEI